MKNYTNIEQSKKLAEILPLESADYHYIAQGEKSYFYPYSLSSDAVKDYDEEIKYVPCWSLAALRNLLPPAIKPNKDSYLFLFESHNTFDKSWVYRYYNEDDTSYLYYKNTNEVDDCVEMIEKLHELNLL